MRPEHYHTHSGDINILNVDWPAFCSSVNIYEAGCAFQNVSGGLYLCTEVAWELIYRQSDIDFRKMCLPHSVLSDFWCSAGVFISACIKWYSLETQPDAKEVLKNKLKHQRLWIQSASFQVRVLLFKVHVLVCLWIYITLRTNKSTFSLVLF